MHRFFATTLVLSSPIVGCSPASKSAGMLSGDSSGSQGEENTAGSCEGSAFADDFDRSCSTHEQCVAVFEGPATDACRGCAGAAIHVDEAAAYAAALGPASCSEGECLADCVDGEGDAGLCILGQCEAAAERFPCGAGACRTGIELCVISEDECSSCVPLDSECSASDGCDCIADVDPSAWTTPCADAPMCEPSGDGLLVRCTADGWGCG